MNIMNGEYDIDIGFQINQLQEHIQECIEIFELDNNCKIDIIDKFGDKVKILIKS